MHIRKVFHVFLKKGARRAGFPARRAGKPFQTPFGEAEGRWGGFPGLSGSFEEAFGVIPSFRFSLIFPPPPYAREKVKIRLLRRRSDFDVLKNRQHL